jgi:hypothetical protein
VERPAELRVQRVVEQEELNLQVGLAEHRDGALLITEPQERSFWVEIAMTKVVAEAADGSAAAEAQTRVVARLLADGVVEAAQAMWRFFQMEQQTPAATLHQVEASML